MSCKWQYIDIYIHIFIFIYIFICLHMYLCIYIYTYRYTQMHIIVWSLMVPHREITCAGNATETWKIHHNNLAHKSASVDANTLPDWIKRWWDKLFLQNQEQQRLRDVVVR